ncbi:unnamed protein product [Phytophthora fragariaefolia]|uniref:Unnamed protein product n=1 Tax=Phytophthora fragariaefolia TaxID=1490495 RepID=A0A9W6UB92_9STRA|nr:unnamed protein product [Phytophthora fragariaefolia]
MARPDLQKQTASQLNTPPIATQDDTGDDEVCYHEGGDLYAEDVEKEMAVLQEVTVTMDEVTIEDTQVGDPAENTPEEIERLRQIIWKRRHVLMGKGNALPPAAVSIGPDQEFAVGEDDHSIHISVGVPDRDIIKKNGVDIRLCIDYRLVTSLTRLMVYPMLMINDLLEDLDKVFWYCSFDMASGFWVVEKLLDACGRWNLSISVVNSFWGQRKVGNLRHQVSAEGLEANPKDLETLGNLPFPLALRVMRSFLESLKYYRRFIENLAIYAAVLYELREGDFHEIGRQEESNSSGRGTGDVVTSTEQADRWTRAKVAFTMPKAKLVSTPILKHFDSDRTPVSIHYASQWAVSAALVQGLRMLEVNYTLLTTRSIVVLTRHSTLALLVNPTGFQGRLGNWAALLSEWTLEIRKCSKGEDDFLGVIAASITPRAEVDEALIAIAPVKEPRQTIVLPPPIVEEEERLLVASFDGAARTKRSSGAYSAIIWRLPEWTIVSAASGYSPDLTVNDAESRPPAVFQSPGHNGQGADCDLRRLQPGHPPNARRDRVKGSRAPIADEKGARPA